MFSYRVQVKTIFPLKSVADLGGWGLGGGGGWGLGG